MSEPALGQRPAVAPLVAALTAAVLTVLGVLAWQAFDRVPCEGFGCLGPALIGLVVIPPGAILLGWLGLRALGVHRAFVVALLTLLSALVVGGTVRLPDDLDPVYFVLPAVFAAAWTWALARHRRAGAGLALVAVVVVVALTGSLLAQRSADQDAVARLDGTTAPQLVVDDAQWELISTTVRPTTFGTLYDRDDDFRLAVTAARAEPDLDPATDCAEITADLFDNPGEVCTDRGGGLWSVRTGSLVRYLGVLDELDDRPRGVPDDTVVGLAPVSTEQMPEADARGVLTALRPATAEEILDRLPG